MSKLHTLTAKKIDALTKPRDYCDGGGLYLQVKPSGRKSWVFRFKIAGKTRWMGLGAYPDVGLANAREAAARARDKTRNPDGRIDPIQAKQDAAEAKARARAEEQAKAEAEEQAALRTFRNAAAAYIEAHEAGWRNAKHHQQWGNTLATYAYPTIGDLSVAVLNTDHVLGVLEPVWRVKPETAGRVRGRIECVLDYAKVRGWRTGENPARWRGHLDHLLPAHAKIAKVVHHAALPWREISAFMVALSGHEAIAARALRFLILTATRTSEALDATWGEISLDGPDGPLWTIPGARMKGGREHRVPLSDAAVATLQDVAQLRAHAGPDAPVFPGQRPGKPLSNMALLMLLRRMGRGDLTAHGFRSTFRDWCAEATNHQREIAEAALAHVLGDKTEAAYQRGDLLGKRRRLMNDWAQFCADPAPAGRVVPIRAVA
jgi:integrase